MSPPSLSNSSNSKLNQFGLYRTIDERTEEFLKLSRKRQMRQGCVCAAISTAITVAIVVSILLLYEYHVANYRVLNKPSDDNDTEELSERITAKDAKKVAMLPSLLNVLKNGNKNQHYEGTKQVELMHTAEYPIQKDWFAEFTSKIKSSKGTELKTSPIIFLKAPLGMLDFYSKSRETKTKNSIGYVDRRMGFKEYRPESSIVNLSMEKEMIRQDVNVFPLTTKNTKQTGVTGHTSCCTCSKNLQDLIKKLLKNIEQLLINKTLCAKPLKAETKRHSCCQKTAIDKYSYLATSDNPSQSLEHSTDIIVKPINMMKTSINYEETRTVEENTRGMMPENNKFILNETLSDSTINHTYLTPNTDNELFEEYFDYIAKRHSSTMNVTSNTVTSEATLINVSNVDVQVETENNYIDTSTKPEDRKYLYIAKINNPKLKNISTTTTTTIKPYLFTETIKPPNQSGENYDKFLKVLQEYKDIYNETNTFFSKSTVVNEQDLFTAPKNINETLKKLDPENNNTNIYLESIEDTNINLRPPTTNHSNMSDTTKEKILKISNTDYIKLVNGNQKLHLKAKKHNPQYLGKVPGEANNDIANPELTTMKTIKSSTPKLLRVFRIQHNYHDIQRVPYGIYKELETKTDKPDTIEDLEIDDQMRINYGTNSNEELKIKKRLNERFGDMSEYSVPYTVSKLLTGRPSYLEISSRNDWSPHFDEETVDS